MRKGHVRKFRKGFNTTHSTKVSACSRLKTMIESNKMFVNSKPLISELKNFVSNANSFKAKPGQTDDFVMSLVLGLRMIDYISSFEEDVYSAVSSGLGY